MKLLKTKYKNLIFYYLANDKYVGQRVALGKYEPYETELILRQVKKSDVVIDIGANIGHYTILLADKVGKTGKVYAFEPDLVNFEILEKNIKANNLENVVAVKAAVGGKNETKILYKSKENLGDHKLYKNDKFQISNVQKIKIIKLDDYLKKPSVAKAMEGREVDLLKIDTQGWEPEVIKGAKNLIKKWKPIMFMEYCPASYRAAKLDGKKMMEWLKKIYKKFFWIDEWLYIYNNLKREKIDQICDTNKTGYADVWMKKNISFWDEIKGFLDLKIKKWVKIKMIGNL